MAASCLSTGFARLLAQTVSLLSGVEEGVLDYEPYGDAVGLLQLDLVVLPGSGAPAGGVGQRHGQPAIVGALGGLRAALSALQTEAEAHVGDGAVVGMLLMAAMLVVVVATVLYYCSQPPEEADPGTGNGSGRPSLKLVGSPYATGNPYATGGSGRPSLSGSVRFDDTVSTTVGPSSEPSSRESSSAAGSERGIGFHDRNRTNTVGPYPICPHLMIDREARLFVGMDSLLKMSYGTLDIFGASGRILFQADVKKTKEKGRVLSIAPPGSTVGPYMRIFAAPPGDRVPPMKIFGKEKKFYGTLEADPADRSKTTLMRNNQPLMLLERGSIEDFRIDASCMHGPTKVKLAAAARFGGASPHTPSESGEWKIKVEPNVDAFLLTGVMMAVMLLQPMGPSLQAQDLGGYAPPGAGGHGLDAAAADAQVGAARSSTEGRASLGGRLSTGGGVVFLAPAQATMQAPAGQTPVPMGRLGTDERLSLGGRISAPGQ